MDANWKMGEVLEALPGARRALFARYHLGGCQSCAFDEGESLAELCKRAELDTDEVLAHLLSSHEHDMEMLISPTEVVQRKAEVTFVDVRTREEFEAVKIEGAEFFCQELQEKLFKEKPSGLVVLYDHTGKYVLDQVAWFRGHGMPNTFGMKGGIDAWSQEVDPKAMRYRVEV